MTGTPLSPQVFRGAIVAAEPLRPASSVVVFQYNPDELTRTLEPRTVGGDAGSGPLRLSGPPAETMQLSIELDAADHLEAANPAAMALGVRPALATIELMLYPPAPTVIANLALTSMGVVEILPAAAPLTLLVLGPSRVIPVRLTSCAITEQAFDPALNPIRAKVDLGMKVVSYHEAGAASAAGTIALANHVALEVSGVLGTTAAAARAVRAATGL